MSIYSAIDCNIYAFILARSFIPSFSDPVSDGPAFWKVKKFA